MVMKKYEVLQAIEKAGVVAVIRARDSREGMALARAVQKGGIPAVEVTMTVPGAVGILESMASEGGTILGAGTVLDPETARICILAGAQYVVSPHLNESVVTLCNRYSVPCMPGVGTLTELVRALELGVDVVKAFPGDVLGPDFVKAVRGPVPHAKIMPTGGVSPDNLQSWFNAGVFAVGMGSSLTKPGGVAGDMDLVTATARNVVDSIADIRGRK
jgi:2-dehydro-3-deoxyphosphogluconate aldolase/(4S)-4-hydroxy-2-oxoglutarate aldolase